MQQSEANTQSSKYPAHVAGASVGAGTGGGDEVDCNVGADVSVGGASDGSQMHPSVWMLVETVERSFCVHGAVVHEETQKELVGPSRNDSAGEQLITLKASTVPSGQTRPKEYA